MAEVTKDFSEFMNGSGKDCVPGLSNEREIIIHLCWPINADLCLISVPMPKGKRSRPNLRGRKMEQMPKISLGFLLLSGDF